MGPRMNAPRAPCGLRFGGTGTSRREDVRRSAPACAVPSVAAPVAGPRGRCAGLLRGRSPCGRVSDFHGLYTIGNIVAPRTHTYANASLGHESETLVPWPSHAILAGQEVGPAAHCGAQHTAEHARKMYTCA